VLDVLDADELAQAATAESEHVYGGKLKQRWIEQNKPMTSEIPYPVNKSTLIAARPVAFSPSRSAIVMALPGARITTALNCRALSFSAICLHKRFWLAM